MSEIRAIFFDLYGTLLIYGDMDEAGRAANAVAYNALRQYGLRIREREYAERFDRSFEQPNEFENARDEGLTVSERKSRRLYESLGVELPLPDMRRIERESRSVWQSYIALDPETVPTLARLRRSRRLALVTNFGHYPHVEELLPSLGLDSFFEVIVISGEVSVEKPNPRVFDFALEPMGLKPNEVVYVGDDTVDVDGANAAGIEPIRIEREPGEWRHATDAPTVIQRLSELTAMFP